MSDNVSGEALIDLIAQCLREGNLIEIEAVGSFALQGGQVVFQPNDKVRVFLAYAEEDRSLVERLYRDLRKAGFAPWMDVVDLVPGQNWPRAIQREMEIADFVLVSFSYDSVAKRGFFQTELRYALELSEQVPLDEIFLVPLRLCNCEVPLEIQRRTQFIDLFPDYERGLKALISMMKAQSLKREKKKQKRIL